jgi:hypothetical protein
MQPGDYTIDVGLHEATGDLLKRLENVPQGTKVRLNVPRDAITMRTLEDYNMLRDLQKRRQVQLTVASPEPTIIGLARIYGFEVENLSPQKKAPVPAAAVEDEALPQWNRQGTTAPAAAPPDTSWPNYDAAPPPAANGGSDAETRPQIIRPLAETPAVPPAAPPAPAPAPTISENDWLFNGMTPTDTQDLPLPAEEATPRTSTPPPDVTLPNAVRFVPAGQAPEAAPTPPAPAGDDLGDLDNLNFDSAELDAQSEAYMREIASRSAARETAPPADKDKAKPPAPTRDRGLNGGAAAAAGGAAGGLLAGLGLGRGRKPASNGPAEPSTRTFVDNTQPSHGPAVVLGSKVVGGLERRPPAAPPTDEEQAGVSGQPVDGHSNAHLGPIPAAVAVAPPPDAVAVAPPVDRAIPAPRPRLRERPARPQAQQRTSRRGGGLLVLLGVLLILLALSAIVVFNIGPALATATVQLQPRPGDSLGVVRVTVPVLTTGSADAGRAGLAAPSLQVTATTTLTTTQPGAGDTVRMAQPVQAQKFAAAVVSDKTIPTTGVRQQPNKAAVGTIEFTNTSSAAVTIPANTVLTAPNGKKFHTVNTITVAGTNFLGRTFGTGRVDIQANEPGPDSNGLRVGGSYGSAVFATVIPPGGGDTIPVKTIAEKDLADLQGALKADIVARASQELLGKVPPAMQPITCTMPAAIPDTAYEASPLPAVGSDAGEIRGVMTATVDVYAFAPAEADHHAALAVQGAVPTDLPPGIEAQIDPASIDETALTLTQTSGCEGGRVEYTTELHPRILYTVTDPKIIQDQIKQLVHGKTPAEARQLIASSPWGPYIDSAHINLGSSLLNMQQDTLPEAVTNINVQLPAQPGGTATGGGGDVTPTPAVAPAGTDTPAPAGAPAATGEPK